MELKTARLTLLIDPAKKEAFERLCSAQDLTPSQVVRQLIRDYLTQHDVSYVPSGTRAIHGPDPTPARPRKLGLPSKAAQSGKSRR
ncbi:MAG TPA: CopG family transcriptional regulator [Caldimonas sp.]|jgi:hypothetical protein